ncbi:hypothetical protein QZH41_004824 [Actinostola sp. cb2023]|nr:hypothetical protein QZH41_004824 [Actinostola sp. cb2023]
MEWNEKENILKTKRGKKLVLRVDQAITYQALKKEAEDKWKIFHSNMYDPEQSYNLLYEDGSKAVFLPGSTSEEFTLKKYQQEIQKDFKRISLYLVTDEDYKTSIGEGENDDEEELMSSAFETSESKRSKRSSSPIDVTVAVPKKKGTFSASTCSSSSTSASTSTLVSQLNEIIGLDQQLAQQLQDMYDHEDETTIATTSKSQNGADNEEFAITDSSSLINALNSKVDTSGQFYMVLRRGSDLFRKLSIWKRVAKRDDVAENYPLRICYAAEEGIDTGAMSKEFFTVTLQQIGSTMFPSGSPIDSTFHVHNGNFRTCGNIVAASLAQGGPPPSFMEETVYDMMAKSNVDLLNIDVEKHLTTGDKTLIQSIKDDLASNSDTIVDHGYTGPINSSHMEDIVKSIAVSIVSKREVYLKEFMEGLNNFGVADAIKAHPDVLKELFVIPSQNSMKVDANYLFSILVPHYSPQGSTRRQTEEAMMDSFQDLLFRIEDGKSLPSLAEPIAWIEEHPSLSTDDSSAEQPEEYHTADFSVPGVMGWLTGQKHKPLGFYIPFHHYGLTLFWSFKALKSGLRLKRQYTKNQVRLIDDKQTKFDGKRADYLEESEAAHAKSLKISEVSSLA